MKNIFFNNPTILKINFFYDFIEDDKGNKAIIVHNDLDNDPPKRYKKGVLHIRSPNWGIMQDIAIASGSLDPWTGELVIDNYKYKDIKIKRLLVAMEDHKGDFHKINDEKVNGMPLNLVMVISEIIDELIDMSNTGDVLSREESKELSLQCFKYFKALRKKESGKRGAKIPPPPSIISIKNICDSFNVTPDVARSISRRDLEMMNIVSEQDRLSKEFKLK